MADTPSSLNLWFLKVWGLSEQWGLVSGSRSHLTAHYLLHISQGEPRTTLETTDLLLLSSPWFNLAKEKTLFLANPTLFSWLRFFKTKTKGWKPKVCLCWPLTRGPGITSLCQLERWRKKRGTETWIYISKYYPTSLVLLNLTIFYWNIHTFFIVNPDNPCRSPKET